MFFFNSTRSLLTSLKMSCRNPHFSTLWLNNIETELIITDPINAFMRIG